MADNEQQQTEEAASSSMPISYSFETLPVSLESEMRKSYLDYAMSVIVGRALPDVRDGFKPVHRRVLFSMHELGNDYSRPTKKCARIVGDVIGKYHPHGDQAAYQTLVRLAQDFSMRYPLVSGQGNFGSIDGDGAAAMRYTECRLAQIAETMLDGLDEETVDFIPNFDNSEKEPTVLPAKLPNLLVNGSAGIAVGMATNIPTHNLGEVVNACRHLLKNPDADIEELIKLVPAPDFPTGGIIYGINGVREAYRTGRGRVVIRSHTHFEELRNGRQALIVDDVGYQVNKKVLVESIARLMHEKKIEGISDLRDESARTVRIVMELKQGAVGEIVLNQLFKLTSMQSYFNVNMVALVDGQPKLLNLRQIIESFLGHRREVVNRRTIFRLNKNRARGHVLEGLAVALANIDEFIRIIRNAPNPPIAKAQLMARAWQSSLVQTLLAASGNPDDYRPLDIGKEFGLDAEGNYHLSPVQAERILQMALQRLTGLEQDKIINEYKEANAQIADLLDILAKPERVTRIMDDELVEMQAKYGDPRRSEIDPTGDANFDPLDFIAKEENVVTLSREGYVKRQALSDYREQRRGGTGSRATRMKEGDVIEQLIVANTHDRILFFTNFGRVFQLFVYLIPEGSRSSKGKAIVNLFQLQEGERVHVALPVKTFDEEHYVFFATSNGTVKKTVLSEFENVMRAGKRAINLSEDDQLIGVAITDGKHDVMLFSDAGRAVRFDESDVRPTGRAAQGVRGMRCENARVISMLVAEDEEQLVLTACENGYGKCTPITEYTRHGRGTQGMIAIATTERNGKVVAATLVRSEDSVIFLTSQGMLVRSPVKQIRVCGRGTQGVTLIDVKADKLVRISRVPDNDVDVPEDEGAESRPEEHDDEAPTQEAIEDAVPEAVETLDKE